jgi:hypothetical protein
MSDVSKLDLLALLGRIVNEIKGIDDTDLTRAEDNIKRHIKELFPDEFNNRVSE